MLLDWMLSLLPPAYTILNQAAFPLRTLTGWLDSVSHREHAYQHH